jgi:L-lactate utilization protein LutC
MTTAREDILARIRATTRIDEGVATRSYRRATATDRETIVERFCERLADYRAAVRRVSADALEDAIAEVLVGRGAKKVGVPPGLSAAWRPRAGVVEDHGLTVAELDTLDGVMTGCTVAIAETGTIVLAGGPADGRRALTLVPDLHVCVVEESQIVDLVPEAIAALEPLVRELRRPLTFISGPSATSDIELSRVEGVHGPRTLIVFVVRSSAGGEQPILR